jgi:hypothetical protein
MTIPVRLQLSRKKGFDLQAHSLTTNGLLAVNVARPGPWGNPFVVNYDGDRSQCVQKYRQLLGGKLYHFAAADAVHTYAEQNLPDLVGKNLACWCPLDGGPCHADFLLELAFSCQEIAS